MKSLRYLLPAAAIAIAGGIYFLQASHEGDELRRDVQLRRQSANPRSAASGNANGAAKGDETAAFARKLSELRDELQREEQAASEAEQRIAETRAKLPVLKEDEAIVTFGRIDDMGTEAGQALRHVMGPLKGQKTGNGDEMASSFMKLIVWGPEIAGFEETPAEIASFESNMLREIFAFDEAKTRRAEAILRKHFETIKTAGLTAAHAAEPQWRERRSAVITQLLWDLRPLMPPNFADPGLASLVNIGAGMESSAKDQATPENGKPSSSVQMKLVSWPRLPWLPH
jgi:hypothetical protein